MDEQKADSPWKNLIDELGVEADASATERRQPQPTELPSAAKKLDPDRERDTPKAAPSDWGGLASSLGIEVPEPAPELEAEPTEEVAAETPNEDLEDAAKTLEDLPELTTSLEDAISATTEDDEAEGSEAAEDEDDEEAVLDGMSGDDARTAFDALFGDSSDAWAAIPPATETTLDTPLEFTEVDDEESADDDSEIAEEEPEEKPKRRRSRRRRRGRGKRAEGDAVESDKSDDEEKSSDEEGEQDAEDGEDKEKKPRRRRSRRRRRRAPRDGETAERDSGELAPGEDADLEDDDDDDEAPSRGGGRSRAGHRNLPTWSEAIGCIVDSNLEQRKKSPSKPSSSRGRGRGRGRGRNSNNK